MTEPLSTPETLNALLAKAASEWSDADRLSIIEGFRTQRDLWNTEQNLGSRKRVTTKKTPVRKATKDLAFEGLKL